MCRVAAGRAYLVADFNVACDQTHTFFLAWACLALVVYAVGVPLAFYWRLRQHAEVLESPAAVFQLGFLYRDYKPEYYAWETGELVRKFLL